MDRNIPSREVALKIAYATIKMLEREVETVIHYEKDGNFKTHYLVTLNRILEDSKSAAKSLERK